MNIQIKRNGKDVVGYSPGQIDPIELRVCIYFKKDDQIPVSFIKSEFDISGWIIEYNNQAYQCADSRLVNSPLLKTLISPLNKNNKPIDFSANNTTTIG